MAEPISANERKHYAVVRTHGQDKYPIHSVKQARSALREINSAKPPLTNTQKSAVRKEAARYGVKPAHDKGDHDYE